MYMDKPIIKIKNLAPYCSRFLKNRTQVSAGNLPFIRQELINFTGGGIPAEMPDALQPPFGEFCL